LPVTWRGENDQHLVIISACFWNGESMSPGQGLLRHTYSQAEMLRWLTCMRNRRGRLRNQGQSLLASGLRQTSGEGGARGRIRDQRVGLAEKRVERNLTEPTGVEFSVANLTMFVPPYGNLYPKMQLVLSQQQLNSSNPPPTEMARRECIN